MKKQRHVSLPIEHQEENRPSDLNTVFPKTTTFQLIPITSIHPDSTLAKSSLLLKEIEVYANSILQNGFDTAIMVREKSYDHYEIILGSKLYFAANIANVEQIPAIVLNDRYGEYQEEIRTLFNWADLDPIETAKAYRFFLDTFNYTHDELASLLQVSRPLITNQLRILQLPGEIQQHLQQKNLTKSQCHLLLRLPSTEEQIKLAQRIIDEQLSVRKINSIIRKTIGTKTICKNIEDKTQKVRADVEKLLQSITAESAEEVLHLVNHLLKKSSP